MIFNLAKKAEKSIHIPKNGEYDMVFMNIDAFEKGEQLLKLREKVLQGEEDRIDGVETLSVSQTRKFLRERLNDM